MTHNLTSIGQAQAKNPMKSEKIDQNNPGQLRRIIQKLMQKSKTMIEVLESTIKRLQKIEKQKQYWKSSYLNFRELCRQYIEADGIKHFKEIVKLQQQIKRMQVQNQCLLEQSSFKYNPNYISRYQELSHQPKINAQSQYSTENKHNSSTNQLFDFSFSNKKQGKDKSIASISPNGSPVRSEHQINPKKKLIKLQSRNTDKID